jgi:mRNA interferase MazF
VLVISKGSFQEFTNGLLIALPITSRASEGFPLHVALDKRTRTQGEIMVEQPKTLDSKIRKITVLEALPDDLLKSVLKKFDVIFNK